MGVTAMPKAYVIAAETISDEAGSGSDLLFADAQFLGDALVNRLHRC
jgi:hypothetical protein